MWAFTQAILLPPSCQVLIKLEGIALLRARHPSLLHRPRLGARPPHSGARASWSAPPRGETKATAGAQGHCATSPRLPLRRRRPRSGERAQARGPGPRGGKAANARAAGRRRGWGRGSPRFVWRLRSCHRSPTPGPSPPRSGGGASARPRRPPRSPGPTGERGARSLPASPGAQSILTPSPAATRDTESKPPTSPLRCSGARILQSLPAARLSSATSEGRGRGQLGRGGGEAPPTPRPRGARRERVLRGAACAPLTVRGVAPWGSPEGGWGEAGGTRRGLSASSSAPKPGSAHLLAPGPRAGELSGGVP